MLPVVFSLDREGNEMMKRRVLAAALGLNLILGAGLMSSALAAPDPHKSDVCHHTSSATNPFVVINIDNHAVNQHLAHHGGTGPDSVALAGGCEEDLD
jgi:hypothetical protein